MTARDESWMGADEAARLLAVTRSTLYAYVSRGFIRSQAKAGTRERQYSRDDVERLRRRTDARRDPDKAATHTLRWGLPVLESSITLIDDDRLYYRGHDAVTLARSRSLEEVASLIWTGRFGPLPPPTPPRPPAPRAHARRTQALRMSSSRTAVRTETPRTASGTDPRRTNAVRTEALPAEALRAEARRAEPRRSPVLRTTARQPPALRPPTSSALAPSTATADLPFIPRAQAMLAEASVHDPLAFDLRPERVAACGWSILHLLTRVATGGTEAQRRIGTIDESLARAWRVRAQGVALIRAALILCADHELNVSSFTARCVASANADPYAVVVAGLAALGGTKHGGLGARVDSMLDSFRRARDLREALADRLRRGEPLYGFGHPLYRTGDPRATALLDLLRAHYAGSREFVFIEAVVEAAMTLVREAPTIDFALAALTRVMRLPPGSALTLFALGRTIGWIGHALEQYATDQLIRPRAKYVGVQPGPQPSR